MTFKSSIRHIPKRGGRIGLKKSCGELKKLQAEKNKRTEKNLKEG